jgi:hypothetical protein
MKCDEGDVAVGISPVIQRYVLLTHAHREERDREGGGE